MHPWRSFAFTLIPMAAFYGPCLAGMLADGAPGGLRALTSWAAWGVLMWHQVRLHGARAQASRSVYVLAFAAAGLGALGATVAPPLWMLALASWTLACAVSLGGWAQAARQPLIVVLGALAYPVESWFTGPVDAFLQLTTARAAALLVNGTGLAVTVHGVAPPALWGPRDLVVAVTSTCAGTATLWALVTLAVVLAEVAFTQPRAQAVFVLVAPLVGMLGNVLRVALSTHAADRWAEQPVAWAVAHDGIGYVTFGLTYLALFVWVRALRQWRPRASMPAATSSTSGHNVASP